MDIKLIAKLPVVKTQAEKPSEKLQKRANRLTIRRLIAT